MVLEHWNANTGYYRQSDHSGVTDSVTRGYGRLIAVAGALGTPAPLRGPDDPWHLHVLAHPHCPHVLKAQIVAPDDLPVATLAVAQGSGDGPRRAWRETVDAAPWMLDGCDPVDFGDPPDGPWVMTALLPAVADHTEVLEWLDEVEQCIGWAFLKGLRPAASA